MNSKTVFSIALRSIKYGKILALIGVFVFVSGFMTKSFLDDSTRTILFSRGMDMIVVGLVMVAVNFFIKRQQKNSIYFGIKDACCQDSNITPYVDDLFKCMFCNRTFKKKVPA